MFDIESRVEEIMAIYQESKNMPGSVLDTLHFTSFINY